MGISGWVGDSLRCASVRVSNSRATALAARVAATTNAARASALTTRYGMKPTSCRTRSLSAVRTRIPGKRFATAKALAAGEIPSSTSLVRSALTLSTRK